MLKVVCLKNTNKGGKKMSQKSKRLTITLAPNVYENLEKKAEEKGLSKSAYITLALVEQMKGQKNA